MKRAIPPRTSNTTTPKPISSAVEIPPELLLVLGFGTVNGAVCVGVVVVGVVWPDWVESPGSVDSDPLLPVEDAALAEGASASAAASVAMSLVRIVAI